MEKATIEDYKNVHNQNKDLLMVSIHHFRKIMSDGKYTLEEKNLSFASLLTDYMRCKTTETEEQFFMATKMEWEMRQSYLLLQCKKENDAAEIKNPTPSR